ncbi:MAG: sigma factor, partial [Planctomycetota bacterium]
MTTSATEPEPLPADAETLASEPHREHAHGIARHLLGCDHLAADAVQEALVALWREATPPADVRG